VDVGQKDLPPSGPDGRTNFKHLSLTRKTVGGNYEPLTGYLA